MCYFSYYYNNFYLSYDIDRWEVFILEYNGNVEVFYKNKKNDGGSIIFGKVEPIGTLPQINACQNINKCSKMIRTNALIEGMELYVES